MSMLHLRAITHGFGPTPVLADIELSVMRNEIVCLIGPSGCGKSTLLRIAGDLLAPDSGRVENRFNDRAFVFQEARLLPWRRVLDNVLLGRRSQRARSGARQLLEGLGLGDWLSAFPHQLSGGMRQRVAIARALATDAGLLLLDEPFSALDPHRRVALQEVIGERCRQGHRAALFVTHDLPEAMRIGDRVLVLGGTPARIVASADGLGPEADEAEAFAAAARLLREPDVRAAFSHPNPEEIPA